MDATDSKASVVIKVHNIVNETTSDSCPSLEQIPLTANPSILLHVLSSYGLEPKDLVALEATCKFFRSPVGGHLSAVLSREGQVYTFCWGCDERLGHDSDPTDLEPRLLSRPLEDALVVQIAAGNCYLLMLAYQPTGMSVYSVGCGLGGKLGHGCKTDLGIPRMIEHFQALNVKPVSISAGAFHCAVLASDGRVFTWGWHYYGCLGHDHEQESVELPTAVAGLVSVKARHVSAGYCSTFVVADNGDVYSFGCHLLRNLGFEAAGVGDAGQRIPKLATWIAALDEKAVQISATNTLDALALIHSSSPSPAGSTPLAQVAMGSLV